MEQNSGVIQEIEAIQRNIAKLEGPLTNIGPVAKIELLTAKYALSQLIILSSVGGKIIGSNWPTARPLTETLRFKLLILPFLK